MIGLANSPRLEPDTSAIDDQIIAKSYKRRIDNYIVATIPIALAYFGADLRWIVAVSAALLLYATVDIDKKMFDLCLRASRAKPHLSTHDSTAAERLELLKTISLRLYYIVERFDAEKVSTRKLKALRAAQVAKITELSERSVARGSAVD